MRNTPIEMHLIFGAGFILHITVHIITSLFTGLNTPCDFTIFHLWNRHFFLFVSLIAGVTLDDLRSALKESEILDFDEEACGR